jgi:hypothetical protein
MKIISLLSVLASVTAAVALPVRLEIAVEVILVAGLSLIIAQDYSTRRPLRFETASPAASQFTARHFFRHRSAATAATFRAPALTVESNRLAA